MISNLASWMLSRPAACSCDTRLLVGVAARWWRLRQEHKEGGRRGRDGVTGQVSVRRDGAGWDNRQRNQRKKREERSRCAGSLETERQEVSSAVIT